MAKGKANSPLLGYNTNVRHSGELFHIQTEDSGISHPHIITHLFVEGTILATKKTSYAQLLERGDFEEPVRQLMKDQHKAMFVELREGAHDQVTARILGRAHGAQPTEEAQPRKAPSQPPERHSQAPTLEIGPDKGVRVVRPAELGARPGGSDADKPAAAARTKGIGRSIFDTPNDKGEFGEDLITNKSLDEVILSYLTDELDE